MSTDPTNFLGALGGAQSLPNSYAVGQQVQADQIGNQQRQAAATLLGAQAQAAQAQLRENQDYQLAAKAAIADGSPRAIASLITRFPDQHQAIAKGWDIKEGAQKQSDLRSAGEVLSALDNGRPDLAASSMQARIDAEEAAGQDTAQDKQVLAAIKSGDQAAINSARGALRYTLSAVVPDKFAEVLGKVGGDQSSKTKVVMPGGALVDDAGKELYRAAEAPKYEKLTNGDGSETLVQVGGGPVQTNPAGATATSANGAPLSTRLNNPGAIRFDPKNQWQGQTGNVGGFVQFDSPEAGARAQKILLSNQIKNGFDTPLTWAKHYAPASDGNDPVKYAQTIASGLGIGVDDKIPLSAVPKMAHLSAEVEAGGTPAPSGSAPGVKTLFTSKPANSEVDDATVNFYAQKVAAGGDLPQLGMGKQAAALRQAILAKSAQIQTGQGMSGGDSNLLHADVKSAGMALTALQKTRNSLDPFLQTFDGASEQVRKLAPMGVAGGVPLFNKWKQASRAQIMGDPQLAKFDVAIAAVANENAKIMSGASGGSVTSDSARNEAHALINRAQSLPQLLGALDQMKTDTQIRLKSLDDRQSALRAQISGKPAVSSAPVRITSPAQAQALPSGTLFITPDGRTLRKR